ncbi:GspE/PulE family protein [Arthrobacter sp. zg-Y1110]|uniref:GspE/PulE family protein n=1 Tax=Arthrobacter sp. zg-Y1110 TaxID=2886932 RepID=UPI001D15A603|nr:GspE/PulE family protein [Arthrobacter sp. zg-Y1110]MCC3292569.1 GspE/PulE family protein [Arthrobacter sp. zg-Y1110]UWX86999.1 GspE/PulE family protein [Arthrobacter sp. zg-Y1110]
MSSLRLSTFFISRGILSQEAWDGAEAQASIAGKTVLRHLVDTQMITTAQASEAFAYSRGWTYYPLGTDLEIPEEVIGLLKDPFAREHQLIPVSREGDELTVAVRNPSDLNVSKLLRGATGLSINLVYSTGDELTRSVHKYYSTSAEARRKGELATKAVEASSVRYQGIGKLADTGEIVDALNIIIEGALRVGASDIHLEPAEHHLSVRYSVDGKLVSEPIQSRSIAPRLASLIKTRAKMNSAALTNQDGGIRHTYEGRDYDIRVAVLPTNWGESITMRLGAETVRDLTEIGFATDTEARWRRVLAQPNGISLAVGPMGSGKTTLLYASLAELMKEQRKIVSLEAPVEMNFPSGITQVSINPGQKLTWEGAMETVLRSAASALLVGEINKEEVAHTAINAAMTGHLVLSTLHTNDAPGAVVRLREMGIRPSVLADTMRSVCAQRLPRTLCECKVLEAPSQQLIRDFGLDAESLAANEWFGPNPAGCRVCAGRGYKGRTPIHELMTFPAEIRDLITEDVPNRLIGEAARRNGMRTLQEDGLLKARAGITSLSEIRSNILID